MEETERSPVDGAGTDQVDNTQNNSVEESALLSNEAQLRLNSISISNCSSDSTSDSSDETSSTVSSSSCPSTSASEDEEDEEDEDKDDEDEQYDEDLPNDCDDAGLSSSTAWVWVPGKERKVRRLNAGLVKDLADASVCELIRLNSSEKRSTCANFDFTFLVQSNEEYVHLLKGILDVHKKMREVTPQHIRQHFDMALKQVELLYQFQLELNEAVKASHGNLDTLAEVFINEQFSSYKRYILMMPRVQKKLSHYSSYFQEHFPTFKKDIMTPSLRVNFYALVLKSLKARGTKSEREALQMAIDYLDLLNRRANTEMTVATVVDCPVDLRLSGDLLLVDEFYYLAGPLTKKKYTLILFERIFLFTISNVTCFKLVAYYRPGQVDSVTMEGERELFVFIKPSQRQQFIRHVVKPRNPSSRSVWNEKLGEFVPSYKSTVRASVVSLPQRRNVELLPLSLTSEYPHLQEALASPRNHRDSYRSDEAPNEEFLSTLAAREENYVSQLNQIVHEDCDIPRSMLGLLTRIQNLHSKRLLPKLQKACEQGIPKVILCFKDNMHDFSVYSEYLATSVQNAYLPDSNEHLDNVSAPVDHFIFYLMWFSEIGSEADGILDALHGIVANARARILSDAIMDSRVDFFRSGKVLRCDTLRVTTPHKSIRDGIYKALLFREVVILTRVKAPFYEYVCDVRLDEVNLGPLKGSCPTDFRLEVRRGGGRAPHVYEFRARTQEVKDAWIKHLKKEFVGQAEAIKRQSSFSHL